MRACDRRNDRARARAGTIAVLALVLINPRAHGQQPNESSGAVGAILDPVALSADRVRYWDLERGQRWAVLEGRAAALQGVDGLRADQIVARIETIGGGYRVSVYAEGNARGTDPSVRPSKSMKLELSSRRDVTLQSYRGSPQRLEAAPADLAILRRAFPAGEDAVNSAPIEEAPPATVKSPRPTSRQSLEAHGTRVPTLEPIEDRAASSNAPTASEVVPPDPRSNDQPTDAAAAPANPQNAAPATDAGKAIEQPPPIESASASAKPDDAPPPLVADSTPKRDAAVRRVQDGGQDPFSGESDPVDMAPSIDQTPGPAQLPDPIGDVPPDGNGARAPGVLVPILPETKRFISINPRSGGPNFDFKTLPETEDGQITAIIDGGVNIVVRLPGRGDVDLSADHVVIFTKRGKEGDVALPQPGTEANQDQKLPLEIYLEGNVVAFLDSRREAGNADQRIFRAERAFYNVQTERLVALNGEVELFAPGLISPVRTTADVINQYKPFLRDAEGILRPGPAQIRADVTSSTGSRFPNPGYRFDSKSIDITGLAEPLIDPVTGGAVGPTHDPRTPKNTVWRIDARQNLYYIGGVPVFYLPRIVTDSDFDPILRNLSYRYGNYFGHQVMFDVSGFRLFNIRKPQWIDNWNLDLDYLSLRGVAFGSELGWFGKDLVGDLMDPYHNRNLKRGVDRPYFGYFDVWGLHDAGNDVLGPGPAIITNGPPGAGKAGFQRTDNPAFQNPRFRFLVRHMQSFIDTDIPDEDMRLQLEAAYTTDRNFLEEYYKRLFDTGYDQATLAYFIRQKQNRAFTVHAEANLQDWLTDTQWAPKLSYYRLGDSFLDNWITHFSNSGVDYANTHTAVEVNNPNIFAFLPFDPVSNTFGTMRTGRMWTSHEIDVPLNFEFIRMVPYAQGQLAAWDNQLGGRRVGRAWGAVGGRANIFAWRTFDGDWAESELLNIHGLAHKVSLDADFRAAFSNVSLQTLGVQDQLDDNTYEYVRRYFALTNYVGGMLPPQYDPRFLTLRRTISPISGTTDVQDSITTLRFGVHQRLQTKRGPEDKRRIMDYMLFDVDATYFPNASRDNFGKPFGQTQYNWEWFIGDRTSIISSGWFEFFEIAGSPILISNPRGTNDPFGLKVINNGISIARPPRGSVYIGYSIINTGPISTSALNANYSYWMSPKWYSTVSTSYDFGNAILLGATVALTRIGADYITSIGLSVDPQRNNYTFGVEIAPRFSPNIRLGSIGGYRFDSRFAPTQ